MANTDIRSTTTSNLEGNYDDYSVDAKDVDGVRDQDETTYYFTNWTQYNGYYKEIPELRQAVNALAMWTCGKGWTADVPTTLNLGKITGWGEDSFQSIMENMIIVKKINGDSFAEIIRNEKGTLINLKPLNPGNISIVVGRDGIIKRYDLLDKQGKKTNKSLKPSEVLHLCNDRVADEIHGVSVVESCEEIILARNEALTDRRKVMHRNVNPLKIFELDEDDPARINSFKAQYLNMTKDYEALFVPKGNASVTIPNVPIQDSQGWITYLEDFFYRAVGVPKIILGGAQEYTEASSKIGYLTFEQVYMREQRLLEDDLWNQLAIKVKFDRPVSLKEDVLSAEAANTGQTGFQANETQVGVGRNE